MIHQKRGGALRWLQINREILILRKPPIEVVLLYDTTYLIISRKKTDVRYKLKCCDEIMDLRGNSIGTDGRTTTMQV